MAQDKLFLEENFNLHKSELEWVKTNIEKKEAWIKEYKTFALKEHDTLTDAFDEQITVLRNIKKSLEKLVELEKMYNIYQKTETDEKIIVGNILNILGDDK